MDLSAAGMSSSEEQVKPPGFLLRHEVNDIALWFLFCFLFVGMRKHLRASAQAIFGHAWEHDVLYIVVRMLPAGDWNYLLLFI